MFSWLYYPLWILTIVLYVVTMMRQGWKIRRFTEGSFVLGKGEKLIVESAEAPHVRIWARKNFSLNYEGGTVTGVEFSKDLFQCSATLRGQIYDLTGAGEVHISVQEPENWRFAVLPSKSSKILTAAASLVWVIAVSGIFIMTHFGLVD